MKLNTTGTYRTRKDAFKKLEKIAEIANEVQVGNVTSSVLTRFAIYDFIYRYNKDETFREMINNISLFIVKREDECFKEHNNKSFIDDYIKCSVFAKSVNIQDKQSESVSNLKMIIDLLERG